MTVQSYKYDNKSEAIQSVNADSFDISLLTKDMEVLGGKGEWKQILGYKVFVDEGGMVSKGPDPFIGQKISDLENLTYNQGMTVGLSVQRAMGETNKAFDYEDTEEVRLEKSNAVKFARDLIAQCIEGNSKSRYASKDPLDAVEA